MITETEFVNRCFDRRDPETERAYCLLSLRTAHPTNATHTIDSAK